MMKENPECVIRVALEEDMQGLARLNKLFNSGSNSAEDIWQRINQPKCVETALVALINGRTIGFAGLRITPTIFYEGVHAEVTELFVETGYRRRGAATALMDAAMKLAKSRGAEEIMLLTDGI